MKLLIITQKVDENDDVLGFFHGWVEEFAKHCEKITVICLYEGKHHLPKNVKVLSLGKEKTSQKSIKSKIHKVFYILNFYKYIFKERKNYDTVFVHMNPEYAVLGGVFWKLFNKKISLWYAHGHTSLSLRIAEKFTDIIFTSTKSGFRLKSNKIKIMGQGIDVDYFKPLKDKLENDIFQIITIGRISPIKDYETLIKSAEILKKEGVKFKINIIGGPATKEQKEYFIKLKTIVKEKELNSIIFFIGPKTNKEILPFLQKSDLFVNMSHTGSLDKAILEAMACELPVLTCNEALKEVFGADRDKLMFLKRDYKSLATRIKYIISMSSSDRKSLGDKFRDIVIKNHNIDNFIGRIINFYESLYTSK